MAKYIGYIGVIITLLSFLIGGVTWFNSITAQAETTKTKVEEVDKKVTELEKEGAKELEKIKDNTKKEIDENEKVDAQQTITLEKISVTQQYMIDTLKALTEEIKKKK